MPADRRRRLVWHAVLLFLLFLLEGAFVTAMRNPRLGVSAHVGGLMSALFLGFVGAVWDELRLPDGLATLAFWLALVGAYGSSFSVLLAAVLGTATGTPLSGATLGSAAENALVGAALVSTAAAMLGCCALLLWGFRGRAR